MKKRLFYIVIAAFAAFAAVSCEEDNPNGGGTYPGNGNELDGCTALYNGFSTAFGVE